MRARLSGALVAVVGLGLASPAGAYVRSRTGSDTPVAFDSACVFVQTDSRGSVDMPFADVLAVVDKSLTNWQGIGACSYLQLKTTATAQRDALYDGRNVIQFLSDRWCHPADKQSPERCYDASAAAITTVFFLDRKGEDHDGTIVDADIEMNEVNFTFVNLPTTMTIRMGTAAADLENTLTHEIGHLMGLDHTCTDSSTPENAKDQNGAKPPNCDQLRDLSTAARHLIEDATMYNRADQGETKKRSPEADDVAGICEAYPVAKTPSRCGEVDLSRYTGGCAVAPRAAATSGQVAAALGLLLVALLGLVLRPRRAGS